MGELSPTVERLRSMLDNALLQDPDFMVATGDDLDWLMAQLANWPTRVDHLKTTNMRFLLLSAAASLQFAAARIKQLETAARYLRPYLDWTIGPESPGHHPTMPSAVAAFKQSVGVTALAVPVLIPNETRTP